ncbi:MAG: YqgE/AlgH family protein [Gallionella sp.]
MPTAFLLVSSQQMADPRFQQTVLVVTRHGNTGPVGIIINRPEKVMLDEVFPSHPTAKNIAVLNGGPVYPAQFSYLVRGAEPTSNTLKISGETCLGYDTKILEEMLDGKRSYKDLRVAHGMATWAPGQLEYEIKLGDWTAIPIDDALIFDRPTSELWLELNQRVTHMHEL